MIYKDDEHKAFYDECIARTNAKSDPYRKALFYTLGLTNETRRHIKDMYDFDENGIICEGIACAWQTSSTRRVTRLAFNLYNNFHGESYTETGMEVIDPQKHYTPEDIFCDSLMFYMFEAVKLRYPEYYQPNGQ